MTTLQQTMSHRWRVPARAFTVHSADGVGIEGTRLGNPGTDLPALVLGHGLMGWHRKPRFARFAERLTPWFSVYPFDFRGHGRSRGVCDYGGAEIDDVEAVVGLTRRAGFDQVVTCGTSTGAIAVLRHGGLIGGVDTVVGISSLAYWDWHDGAHPKAARNMRARISTPVGRAALKAWGVRLPEEWPKEATAPESPEEVIGRISPTPLVICHGRDDHLFGEDHPRRLYQAAGEPKRMLLGDRFGHAEDGLTPEFARRLAKVVYEDLELPWSA